MYTKRLKMSYMNYDFITITLTMTNFVKYYKYALDCKMKMLQIVGNVCVREREHVEIISIINVI